MTFEMVDCITPKRSAILCCVLPSSEGATATAHSSGVQTNQTTILMSNLNRRPANSIIIFSLFSFFIKLNAFLLIKGIS
jgi:hypothetical protein